VNFAAFDANANGVIDQQELHIIVMVAGYERSFSTTTCGSSIWGHHWSLSGAVPAPLLAGKRVGEHYVQFGEWHCDTGNAPGHLATIGIMAHELGHDLGLPDLYDIDESSEGVGEWDIMGTGAWNEISLPGDSPAHMGPWSKFFEGWITPTLVSGILPNELIAQAAFNADVYQLRNGTPLSGEYFLVENRQKVGYDAGLPAVGLLIWHIDASINPGDNTENSHECFPGSPPCVFQHYKVALVQADNLYQLEGSFHGQNRGDGGDPWPGTTGNTTFDSTATPNSNLYNGSVAGVAVGSIGGPGPTMTATLGVEPQIFADVPVLYWAKAWIEALYTEGVTGGCSASPLNYCPGASLTREQMAIFLLKARFGPHFAPSPCTTAPFTDVPCSSLFAPWIRELATLGISSGCGGGKYCPGSSVTREQMAVFIVKTLGDPPASCGTAPFADVPCSSPFAPWIKALVAQGITAGCTASRYCPGSAVTRAEMAVFLLKAFFPSAPVPKRGPLVTRR
jgi:M6 family metalloprotease-like protein